MRPMTAETTDVQSRQLMRQTPEREMCEGREGSVGRERRLQNPGFLRSATE